YSGVCSTDTTQRCSVGDLSLCGPGATCNSFCSNGNPSSPTPCTPATAATDCHDALATCDVFLCSNDTTKTCSPPNLSNCPAGATCNSVTHASCTNPTVN